MYPMICGKIIIFFVKLQKNYSGTIFCFQLSCDLNPAPVSSGQGFDYDLIARRAAANIQLARSVDEATTASRFKFD